MDRHYYKCGDCLSPMVTEGRQAADAECFCGGRLSYMGKVKQDNHIHKERSETPCNTLCTAAKDHYCNCSCGGKNHGVRMSADIKLDLDRGLAILTPPNLEKAIARAAEYRIARDAAWQRLVVRHGINLTTAEWLARSLWEAITEDKAAWRHAKSMKVHSARMKALEKVGR